MPVDKLPIRLSNAVRVVQSRGRLVMWRFCSRLERLSTVLELFTSRVMHAHSPQSGLFDFLSPISYLVRACVHQNSSRSVSKNALCTKNCNVELVSSNNFEPVRSARTR